MNSAALFLDLLLATLPMVTSDSACPSTKSIETHLSTLLNPDVAQPGQTIIEGHPDKLTIRLRPEGETGAELVIAVEGSCEDRAMAAAVAIATWWQMRAGRAEPNLPTTEGEGEPQATTVAAVAVSARRERRRSTVALDAGGFASMVADSVAPGARVGLDWAPSGASLSVRFAMAATGGHSGPVAVGQAVWQRLSAEVGVAWSRQPLQIDARVILGRLFVSGTDFPSNEKSSGFSLGFSLAPRLGWSIGRVTLWAEVRAVVWPQSQRIFAEDVVTSGRSSRGLPRGELQPGAGVSVRLF